jgi:tRNA pseudouridine55 synthase
VNGILLIDKPADWTSHDVVAKLRGILHERRIGHSGTLDPMATGLLVVFVGRATRAVEFAEAQEKAYLAGLRPGVVTDTLDITGTILRQTPHQVTRAELEAVLPAFRGEISQVPPMYSAIKVDGQKLYQLARKGKEVERRPRTVTISRLEIAGESDGDFLLDVRCSKGTYIRSLCADIGERLGCGGTMSSLRRTSAGEFRCEDAYTLEAVAAAMAEGCAQKLLLGTDSLFRNCPRLALTEMQEKKCRCGTPFPATAVDGTYRVYAQNGAFLMLGRVQNGRVETIKSFFEV